MTNDALISEIIELYRQGNPTRQNSRTLVAKIAQSTELSVGKVRNILIKAGVYVSLPKDRNKIDEADFDEILEAFQEHCAQRGISKDYFGPDDLTSELSQRLGYGKWALGDLYREWRESGQHQSSEQFQSAREQQREERLQQVLGIEPTRPAKKESKLFGWFVAIGLGLAITSCMNSIDPDEGKSELQKTCERTLGESGFDCG